MNKKEIPYQFTAMPVNLTACMDNNCRSMLFTLLQLSSYYADEDGWFYRTSMDLQMQSRLSDKLVTEVISKFHRIGILDVQSVGQSKGKFPNRFRLNQEKFLQWEKQRLEDCLKNPNLYIEKEDRKQKGWKPSYLTSKNNSADDANASLNVSRNPHNIENADNGEITENEEKKKENIDTYQGTLGTGVYNHQNVDEETERGFLYQVQYYIDRIQHASHWREWENHLTDLDRLIIGAPTHELGELAKAKLSPILREEVQSYKRKYEEAANNSGDDYDVYSTNPDEVDEDGDEDGFEEPDLEAEADDFYSQLKEWKEYAKEGAEAFSYFREEPLNCS